MRRLILALLAIVVFGAPALCRADELTEQENPREYNDEDSQPLKIASYFVAPVGFVLEWTVARPLHYIMEETFLAPAMDSGYSHDAAPAPIAELPPPDYLPPRDPIPKLRLHEETLASHAPASTLVETQPVSPAPVETQPSVALPPPAPDAGGQPYLH